MELSELGPTVTIIEALDELGALGTSAAIATRMRELGIRGGHLSMNCPIHHYLAMRTGLDRLAVGSTSWSTYGGGAPADDDSGNLPDPVMEFINDHDNHRYPDLYAAA